MMSVARSESFAARPSAQACLSPRRRELLRRRRERPGARLVGDVEPGGDGVRAVGAAFRGLDYFPYDPEWRLIGTIFFIQKATRKPADGVKPHPGLA